MFRFIFFFRQKTADEMRISDWSSDVCSSDLRRAASPARRAAPDPTDYAYVAAKPRPSRTETGSPMKPIHSVLAQSPFAPNTLVSAGALEVRLAGDRKSGV